MQLIHVYGPAATGKTLNRDLIAEHFNCDMIIDDGKLVQNGTHRALVLCQEAPDEDAPSDGTFDIDTTRKYILNHPGYAGRWIEPSPKLEPKAASEDANLSSLFLRVPRPLVPTDPRVEIRNTVHFDDLKEPDPDYLCPDTRKMAENMIGAMMQTPDIYPRALYGRQPCESDAACNAPPLGNDGQPATETPLFKLGAVVRLKSCGKPMTVVSDSCGNTYDVMWFDGTELKEEAFHADCLAPSEPDIDHRFDIPW